MKNKTILVTGGSRGIGRAIVEKLLEKKYDVHIIAKHIESLQNLKTELKKKGEIIIYQVDLSDEKEIRDFCQSWSFPLYGLINNAGICDTERLSEKKKGVWQNVIATNLSGVYFLTKNLAKHIEDNGRIVNISSQLGKEGRAGYSAYSASKFGVIGLTKCWAKELGGRGITVNAVCPGWVETDMSVEDVRRIAKEQGKTFENLYKEICEPLELKRFSKPVEVASLVSFLVSDEASGITGRDILMHTVWNQE